jgi:rhodanese-related sulfurtransferase
MQQVHQWQADSSRTLYLLDVRTREEYEAGHLPGSLHAPGGQLVQATDQWVAVRGARIVLIDDTGLRAANTGLWLTRMGHDACVLRADVTGMANLEKGGQEASPVANTLPVCTGAELAGRLAAGAVIVDLRPSMDYRDGHVEGARWSIRPRLERLGLPAGADVILMADKRGTAEIAALDLREGGIENVGFLEGDLEACRAGGLGIEATPDMPKDDECIDYLFFVHDRHQGNMEAARGYLEWETGLIAQLDAQERAVFTLDFDR